MQLEATAETAEEADVTVREDLPAVLQTAMRKLRRQLLLQKEVTSNHVNAEKNEIQKTAPSEL